MEIVPPGTFSTETAFRARIMARQALPRPQTSVTLVGMGKHEFIAKLMEAGLEGRQVDAIVKLVEAIMSRWPSRPPGKRARSSCSSPARPSCQASTSSSPPMRTRSGARRRLLAVTADVLTPVGAFRHVLSRGQDPAPLETRATLRSTEGTGDPHPSDLEAVVLGADRGHGPVLHERIPGQVAPRDVGAATEARARTEAHARSRAGVPRRAPRAAARRLKKAMVENFRNARPT
jgi:hypothetical protein